MYPKSSEGLNRETDKAVYFFTTAFHPFDNFSAHQVELWDKCFPTAEHAYQWKKFTDTDAKTAAAIFDASSPDVVKKISEALSGSVPPVWHKRKVAVMEEILRAKATQHEDVRDALRRTAGRTIVENSPADSFWGIGADEKGENTLGKLWMKLRDELKLQASS